MLKELKIAIVATSHAVMGDGGEPTGVWLEELTTPYYTFRDAGLDVDVYSIAGGAIPIDPRSLKPKGENEASVERYLIDEQAKRAFEATRPVGELQLPSYSTVFLPGGHGTMWDYPTSATLAKIVGTALDEGRIVAAVCHGPAGLVSAKTAAGKPVVEGRKIAAFKDTEEEAAGLTGSVPFLLETRLRDLGADYQSGPDFQAFALRDGNLITGQNPASAVLVAQYVVDAIREGVLAEAAE